MGRALRAIDPDYCYHVFSRGSNRAPIVFDAHDCEAFVDEFSRVASRFHWGVLAWCLMPNHHHAILRSEQSAFSAGYRQLNGNHSRRTNARHDRRDHLFRHRPRTVCCRSTAHLIGAVAYVARNPVTAGLVENAAAWPWSSYRATVGDAAVPHWLCADEVLSLFGSTPEPARQAFDELVHNGHLLVSDTGSGPPGPVLAIPG